MYSLQMTVRGRNKSKMQMRKSDLVNARCICNPLAPELLFLILAHPVYKMWLILEPNKLALWNKLHFEEEETESIEHV